VYLHCPECRLTVYRRIEQSTAEARCPRCGGPAVWSSPPFARSGELSRMRRGSSRAPRPERVPGGRP